MSRSILYIFLTLVISSNCLSQVRVIKPVKVHPIHTNLGIGVSVTSSDLFLTRNTASGNNGLGITGSIVYGGFKSLRVTLEYTHYKAIDIAPTWYDVRSSSLESNVHLMCKAKSDFYFYPMFGLSYNVFSGYFTGKNDYLHLGSIYPSNQDVVTRWLGLNAGIGLEYNLKPIVIAAGYKMRIGASDRDNTLNILDVCFNVGVRYTLVVPSIHRLVKGNKQRYYLDKRREK